MPRVRRRGHVATMLTMEQTMELTLGPSRGAFANDLERRSAWIRHRDYLMTSLNEFTRPWAYWNYEIGRMPEYPDGSFRLLSELGLLTEREKARFANDPILASMLTRRVNA